MLPGPRRGPGVDPGVGAGLLLAADPGRAWQEGVGARGVRRDAVAPVHALLPQQRHQQRDAPRRAVLRVGGAGGAHARPRPLLPVPDADHHHPRLRRAGREGRAEPAVRLAAAVAGGAVRGGVQPPPGVPGRHPPAARARQPVPHHAPREPLRRQVGVRAAPVLRSVRFAFFSAISLDY